MCTNLRVLHGPTRSADVRESCCKYRFVRPVNKWIVVMAVCMGATTSAYAGFTDVVDGLSPVAWWRLGEESGLTAADASGGNVGEYVGDPMLGQPGAVVDQADFSVSFDEFDDFVEVPNLTYADDTGQFSLAFFFRTDPG